MADHDAADGEQGQDDPCPAKRRKVVVDLLPGCRIRVLCAC
jgi:hypothetical protein